MDADALEKKYNTLGVDMIQTHQAFCQEVLKLLPGEMAVISNGRVSKEWGDGILLLSCFVLFYGMPVYWHALFSEKEESKCISSSEFPRHSRMILLVL